MAIRARVGIATAQCLRMVDAHHVRPVLAVADLMDANAPTIHPDRLVTDPDRRLDELVGECLVGRVTGEIVAIDFPNLLAPLAVEFDADDDVALSFDWCIRHRDDVAKKVARAGMSILGATELNAGRRFRRQDDFGEALHRLPEF